jgi:hypothetical protein
MSLTFTSSSAERIDRSNCVRPNDAHGTPAVVRDWTGTSAGERSA